eukprot:TRINITY_DN1293_c0_g2_i1.p1 TRINITY_DN1293_c0_g2~~TRINITY_DN1293_c0_g2_i1.p1  ORF type:complete len:102 (+),score=9.01 TRINITY_DN1293_c0_g2_i1:36-341(+)
MGKPAHMTLNLAMKMAERFSLECASKFTKSTEKTAIFDEPNPFHVQVQNSTLPMFFKYYTSLRNNEAPTQRFICTNALYVIWIQDGLYRRHKMGKKIKTGK